MPTAISDRCRQCSKLSLEQALLRHGPEGTGCWEGEPCHKRRTYYRNRDRYNRDRRLKYQQSKQSGVQLQDIPTPTIPAVVVRFYRERKDAPLHALDVMLWIGEEKHQIKANHTLGWTEGQVKAYLRDAIAHLGEQYGVKITGIAATVELDPALCPLDPCPLKHD